MQKKQSKNLRKSIGETWKTWHGKSVKRERSNRENCQEDLQQKNYMGGQISNITKNIGEEWRRTGDDGKARNPQKERR